MPRNGGNIVNSSTNVVQVKYLNPNGVDPLGTSGTLPLGGSATSSSFSCAPATPSSTFATLRNGNYKAWSEYRVITHSTGQAIARALVTKAGYVADHTLPDCNMRDTIALRHINYYAPNASQAL